ncbi:hypothetical protein PMALA_022060 [Plasmodium malariae]|uniref:Uncharacterized protein n=1 Tax=Plasmodium malariae TaxID=5858 RepID=A0A1A8W5P0_PLAMA|nr:hypothetical protein PMALA_022060 [Plasmodium malariae]
MDEMIYTKENINESRNVIEYKKMKKSRYNRHPEMLIENMQEIKGLKNSLSEKEKKEKLNNNRELELILKISSFLENHKLNICEKDNIISKYVKKKVCSKKKKKNEEFSTKLPIITKEDIKEKVKNEILQGINSPGKSYSDENSLIRKNLMDKKNVNKIKIKYNCDKENEYVEGACDVNESSVEVGSSKETKLNDIEQGSKKLWEINDSVPNSNYSFKRKIDTVHSNEGEEYIHESEVHYSDKNRYIGKIDKLFKDSNKFQETLISNDQTVSLSSNISSCKNEYEIFKYNSMNLKNRRRTTEDKWTDTKLSKCGTNPINTLFEKEEVKMNACEIVKRKNYIRHNKEKKDKNTICISNLFSNQKDEYTEYMLKTENEAEEVVNDRNKNNLKAGYNDKILGNVSRISDIPEKVDFNCIPLKKNLLLTVVNWKEPLKFKELNDRTASSLSTVNNLMKNNRKNEFIENKNILSKYKVDMEECDQKYYNNNTFCCSVKADSTAIAATTTVCATTAVTGTTPTRSRSLRFIKQLFKKKIPNGADILKSKSDTHFKFKLNINEKLAKKKFTNPKNMLSSRGCSPYDVKQKPKLFEVPMLPLKKEKYINLYLQNKEESSKKLHTYYCANSHVLMRDNKIKNISQNDKKRMSKSKYSNRITHTKSCNSLLNNTSSTSKLYPQCEIICRIPNKNFINYFCNSNNTPKVLNKKKRIYNNKML